MIQYIIDAAEAVGINAFITNSSENIENQLNRLTKEESLPIMLVSWDIDTTLAFDQHGFLQNPKSSIVALLVTKSEDNTKDEYQKSAVAMGDLFEVFIQKLHTILIPFMKTIEPPISGASYKLVPTHGAGKHSGILGKWTMSSDITVC